MEHVFQQTNIFILKVQILYLISFQHNQNGKLFWCHLNFGRVVTSFLDQQLNEDFHEVVFGYEIEDFLYIVIFGNCSAIQYSQKQPSRGVLRKRCSENSSKFTGEHPCRSAISIKLQSNFNKIALRHGCSLVNLLHVFRTTFTKNTSEGLLLYPLKGTLMQI